MRKCKIVFFYEFKVGVDVKKCLQEVESIFLLHLPAKLNEQQSKNHFKILNSEIK